MNLLNFLKGAITPKTSGGKGNIPYNLMSLLEGLRKKIPPSVEKTIQEDIFAPLRGAAETRAQAKTPMQLAQKMPSIAGQSLLASLGLFGSPFNIVGREAESQLRKVPGMGTQERFGVIPPIAGFGLSIFTPSGISGKAIKGVKLIRNLHPEDAQELMGLIPKIQSAAKKISPDELNDLQTLAERYLPKEYWTATNKTLANIFDQALEKIKAPSPGIKEMLTSQKGFIQIPEKAPGWAKEELDKIITHGEVPTIKPDQIIANADKEINKEMGLTLIDKLTRIFPMSFESAKINSLGSAGKQIVNLGRRANALTIAKSSGMNRIMEEAGVKNLSPEEMKNFYLSREAKEPILNEAVQKARNVLDPIFESVKEKFAQEPGFQPIEDYAPRLANEAGRALFQKSPEEFIKVVTAQTGLDEAAVRKMLTQGERKAFFEYPRILPELEEKFRDFTVQPLLKWGKEVARRESILETFGVNDKNIKTLADETVKGLPFNQQLTRQKMIDEYTDLIKGKGRETAELPGVLNFVRNSMVVSKLTPFTTAANNVQGQIAAYLQDGIKGLADSMKVWEGGKMVKELGLDNIQGKFGDVIDPKGLSSKWMSLIGMNKSENFGIRQSAVASSHAIDRAFNILKKNPANDAAFKLLQKFGMYPERSMLDSDLAKGAISASEKAIGVIEGARQKMFFITPGERPMYAEKPAGSVAYIFHNYLLNQLNLFKQAPLHRQIAYLAVLAPITGLPIAYLRNIISGREQPQTPLEAWSQSVRYGAATPMDIVNSLSYGRGVESLALGGYAPYVGIAEDIAAGKRRTAAKDIFRALPVPGATLLAPRLFPAKSAQAKF